MEVYQDALVVAIFTLVSLVILLHFVLKERDKANEDRDQYKRLYELALSRKQYLDARVDSLTKQKIKLIELMNRSSYLLCKMHREIDELNEDCDLWIDVASKYADKHRRTTWQI